VPPSFGRPAQIGNSRGEDMRRARRFGERQFVRRLALAVLAVSLATVVLVETRAQPAAGEEPALLAADTALNDAMRGADRSTARRLLSLQFTYTDEGGRAYSRKDFLADLRNLSTAPTSDRKVAMYGLVAAVTGDRKPAQGNASFFLDIWVRQKGAWRALAMQNVVLAEASASAASAARGEETKSGECKNPCQTMPYRVRSPAEQEVLNSFLAIEKASIAHDAQEWSKHVADEFVLYRSGFAPISKATRIATIERQKEAASPVIVGELQAVRLVVYGDAAAMIATEIVPDNSRPPYRAARVWVRRNGQWLMAISVQTDIQTP
jgi:hypothetical protein